MANYRVKPNKLNKQTIVFYGNMTAINLATIILTLEAGARVLVCHDNIPSEIKEYFGQFPHPPIFSGNDIESLKDLTVEVNTWINFGGKTGFGYLLNSSLEHDRQIFEENFWLPRKGSLMALNFMKEGGTIINMGSEISVSAQPLLGTFSSAKQALKVFSDTLRSELKDKDVPVEVCLVRPTIIDGSLSAFSPEQFSARDGAPFINAEAILACAENPHRDIFVGGPARLTAIIDTFFPEVKDLMAESKMKELKKESQITRDDNSVSEITTFGVFRALKENLKTSLKDFRKEDGH